MPTSCLQTSKEAKASYKKANHGSAKLTDRERKQLARDLILRDRADRERERESRRQWTIKQKAKKEEQQRDLRQQQGIGLATQLAGYSHTQKRMKSAMEGFLSKGRTSTVKDEAERSDVDADEFDIDEEVLDAELASAEHPFDAMREPEVLVVPVGKPPCSPRPRRSFKASQSFGESIDDDSLIEAETQAITVRTECRLQETNNLKRSHAMMAQGEPALGPSAIDISQPVTNVGREMMPPTSRAAASRMDAIRSQRPSEDQLDILLADVFPSNTQIAHELTSPVIVSSRSLLDANRPRDSVRRLKNPGRHLQTADIRRTPALTTGYTATERPAVRGCSGDRMMRPPPPPPHSARPTTFPRRGPKRLPDHHTSAFSDFGLSTQLVHAVIDDDLDLSDEAAQDLAPKRRSGSPADGLGGSIDYSDSDLDFDAEFG